MELPVKQLSFWNYAMDYCVEPGKFDLWIGGNSREGLKADIQHNSITNSHEKTEFEHEASVTTDLITLVQRPADSRSSPERAERRLAIQTGPAQ